MLSLLGRLCSLPRNRPVAWFPASARWHVISAAIRLHRSLPLISPFGLPSAGYPASARWHVFAPAQLALRANLRLLHLAPAPALDCLTLGICAIARVISAALRLPPSLPLMSPSGLPSAGYPASARWHVFRSQVSGLRFQVSGFRFFFPPKKTVDKKYYTNGV